MKNTISKILLGTSLLFVGVSCDKKLDIEPFQEIDASNSFETDEDIQSAVVGAYSLLGSGSLYGCNLVMLPELQAGENYLNWNGTFASFREVRNKTMTAINTEATRTWRAAYQTINVTNTILANIDKVKDEDLKATLEGEAYMIRGVLYFELARMYGNPIQSGENGLAVPVVLTPTTSKEDLSKNPARDNVGKVYNQAIDDLKKAITLLPEDNGTRGDVFSAMAFLSRVYLQKGDYANAYTVANAIIENGNFALSPSVTAVFRNKNTQESLFEIQQNLQNNAGTGNDGLVTFFAGLPASSSNTSVGYDSYQQVVGRRDANVNVNFYNLYSSQDKRRNELFYLGRSSRRYSGKYVDFGQNFVIMRIAEVYLIRAESAFRTGKTDIALADVNKIRVRAGLDALTNVTIDDILLERRLELAYEGLRVHDIKRLKGTTGTFAWNDTKLVYPIPQREMDTNKSLVQNDGY
ncbi:MAG: RagB/SusD family nutrient uptake outer membrane protein [Spirosomataceae bacterium]